MFEKFKLSRGILILFMVMLIVCACSGRRWLHRTTPTVSHDHGENLIHSHLHRHDEMQRHDHFHPGLQAVSHTHEHQHGHAHSSETNELAAKEKKGLVEVGHVHNKSLTTFWVEPSIQELKCRLRFLSEADGTIGIARLDSDSFVAESFLELKPQQKLFFSKENELYVASLSQDLARDHRTTFVIRDLAIQGSVFDVKFTLPFCSDD